MEAGPVPLTILPATQFHAFAEMVVGWTERDGAAAIAPLLLLGPEMAGEALLPGPDARIAALTFDERLARALP